MQAKELLGQPPELDASAQAGAAAGPPAPAGSRPLLMVDIDGVISLFGPQLHELADRRSLDGSFHSIDGTPHFLSSTAAAHLLLLAGAFDLVWASGWEERANEHLPHLLGLPAQLPFLCFSARARSGGQARVTDAHWKLEAIDAYARARPLAWIDDAFNPACHAWAQARPAPTLLVQTAPADGLTAREARVLMAWAQELEAG